MMNNETRRTENTLLTSLEILQDALKCYSENITMPLTNSGKSPSEITENNREVIIEIYQKLKEALFCGQENAAWYLAQFYYNGWLVKGNYIEGDFFLEIGKKLKSKRCDNTSYKNVTLLPEELEILATKCAEVIASSKLKYQSEITDAIKKEAEAAIIECIKNTKMENIFTFDDTQQDEADKDSPVFRPDKKDHVSLLVQVSKSITTSTEQKNNTEPLAPTPLQNNLDEPDLNSLIPNNLTTAPIPQNSIILTEILGEESKEKTPCFIKCLIL